MLSKMNVEKKVIKASNNPNHNLKNSHFKNSSISSSTSGGNNSNNLENLIFLNSIKINYPINEISSDLLRFIPDAQLDLIKPLISKDPSFIQKKKYSTNVDERNYLTVFEYRLNENWIIWDYSTGYVFFTGLWKSCGNNKTDIVKLVENFPNLSNLVKRVRGGFLKIQGTWLPFDVVKNLAKNFCFNIRYCLIPIFGEDFPNQCLKPSDPSFGKLIDLNSQHQILSAQTQSRRRRSSNINPSSSSSSTHIIKPTLKKRSKSDNFTSPKGASRIQLIELEEILKASKSLHDLSSSNYLFSRQNFQYGGFVWSWNDNNNLCIIGKGGDEDAIIDDEDDATSNTTPIKTINSSPSVLYPSFTQPITPISNPHSAQKAHLLHHHHLDGTGAGANTTTTENTGLGDPSIPKNYDSIDTILNAAHQLMNFHTGGSSGGAVKEEQQFEQGAAADGLRRRKSKMDIDVLLS